MADFLRSDKFRSIKIVTPSGGLIGGDFYKTADTVGVVLNTQAAGEDVVLVYQMDKGIVPKLAASGKSFAKGAKVFYNNSTGEVTPTTASGLFLIGVATEAATATAITVEIDMNGAKVTAI